MFKGMGVIAGDSCCGESAFPLRWPLTLIWKCPPFSHSTLSQNARNMGHPQLLCPLSVMHLEPYRCTFAGFRYLCWCHARGELCLFVGGSNIAGAFGQFKPVISDCEIGGNSRSLHEHLSHVEPGHSNFNWRHP